MTPEEKRADDEQWEAARVRMRLSRAEQGLPAVLSDESAWRMAERLYELGFLDKFIPTEPGSTPSPPSPAPLAQPEEL